MADIHVYSMPRKDGGSLKNFQLPLPEHLYEELANEAKRAGQPATAVARHAIEGWLRQNRRMRLREKMASYARGAGGSAADLDVSLETAAIESLRGAE